MDIITTVIVAVAVFVTLGAAIVTWRMAQTTARTAYVLKSRLKDLAKLETSVAAQNVIIKFQTAGIEELQAEVARLKVEVATWKKKFDTVIAWVRTIAPAGAVDEFLAQLEAGQGG